MKPRQSIQDKVAGTARVVKGRLKKAAGDLVGDDKLHQEGKADEVSGHIQKKVGDIEKVFEK